LVVLGIETTSCLKTKPIPIAVITSAELVADLERTVRANPARSTQMLRPVADLLGAKADRLIAEAR
jgi:hypothetical protein